MHVAGSLFGIGCKRDEGVLERRTLGEIRHVEVDTQSVQVREIEVAEDPCIGQHVCLGDGAVATGVKSKILHVHRNSHRGGRVRKLATEVIVSRCSRAGVCEGVRLSALVFGVFEI